MSLHHNNSRGTTPVTRALETRVILITHTLVQQEIGSTGSSGQAIHLRNHARGRGRDRGPATRIDSASSSGWPIFALGRVRGVVPIDSAGPSGWPSSHSNGVERWYPSTQLGPLDSHHHTQQGREVVPQDRTGERGLSVFCKTKWLTFSLMFASWCCSVPPPPLANSDLLSSAAITSQSYTQ